MLTLSVQEITEEMVQISKEFIDSENKDTKKDLNNVLNENGKNERNPFDSDVILNGVNLSISIWKKELEIYVLAYDKSKRILEELETDSVKLERHKKFLTDSQIKLHFLSAEKEYLVQFLDNERIAAIYEKKVHRKLMLEACRNLSLDLVQIDNLYNLILREVAGRSTKKMYKENYNKTYLSEIEKTAESAQKEREKLKVNAVAVMNLNYWRIEGIRRIYEVFDEDMSKFYNRDLSEFSPKLEENVDKEEQETEILEDIEEVKMPDIINQEDCSEEVVSEIKEPIVGIVEDSDIETEEPISEIVEDSDIEIEEPINKIKELNIEQNREIDINQNSTENLKHKKYTSSKRVLADAIYISLQTHEFGAKKVINSSKKACISNKVQQSGQIIEVQENNLVVEEIVNEYEPEFIDLDAKIAELDIIDEKVKLPKTDVELDDGLSDLDDNIKLNSLEETAEESILDLYFSEDRAKKRKEYEAKKIDEEINEKTEISKKTSIFQKLIGINSRKRKEA